jgi:hypothetical protein
MIVRSKIHGLDLTNNISYVTSLTQMNYQPRNRAVTFDIGIGIVI